MMVLLVGCNSKSIDPSIEEYLIPGDSSIEGIKLWDDILEAEKILSKRFVCEKGTLSEEFEKIPTLFVKNKKGETLLEFPANDEKVYIIRIISPKYKTKEGVHVGSTLADAVKVYGAPEIAYGEGVCAIYEKQGRMTFGLSGNDVYGNINSSNYMKYADRAIIEVIQLH